MKEHNITLSQSFQLEIGDELIDPTIRFHTSGALNESRDNVIVVCHALTANSLVSDWWNGLYGSGNILDPEDYFIICVNNLGSPYGTCSPKHKDNNGDRYGLNFPDYTIRDNARVIIDVLESLSINRIYMAIGGSWGGNIAQEIAIYYGSKIQNLVLMCCSAAESPWAIAIHESQRMVMSSFDDFEKNDDNACLSGLRAARGIALPYYRSHTSFQIRQKEDQIDKLNDFKASSYIRYQGDKFIKRYDAHCYYKQLCALDTHNIGRDRSSIENALSKILAETLVIGFSSDILIPVIEQQRLADHIPNAKFGQIDSPFGHDAFLIETEKIRKLIRKWVDTSKLY